MAKATRQVFNSSLSKSGWIVTSGGKTLSAHERQKESEGAAIAVAKQVHEEGGLAQAVLFQVLVALRRPGANSPDRAHFAAPSQ